MIREERGWASLEQTGVGRPLLKLSPKKLVTETRPAGCRRKYVPEGDQETRAEPVQSSPGLFTGFRKMSQLLVCPGTVR